MCVCSLLTRCGVPPLGLLSELFLVTAEEEKEGEGEVSEGSLHSDLLEVSAITEPVLRNFF